MKPWNGLFQATIFLFFVLTFQAVSQVPEPYGTNIIGVKTISGLHNASYKLNNGQLQVIMPADMAISDIVSGSVKFEFYQLGSGELVTKNFNISDYSLVIENKIIELSGENFKFEVPYNLPAGVLNVALENNNGKVIGRAFFPVRLTKAERFGNKKAMASDFRLPSSGRAGKPVEVSGHFDGDYETTKVSISGRKARILAESPRILIFESPTGITGSRVIGLREGDVSIKNPYMNLDVVTVSEDQAYFVSSVQQNSRLAEKGMRGEFIIEDDDVDETVSKWRRLSPEIPDKYGEEVADTISAGDTSEVITEEPYRSAEVAKNTAAEEITDKKENKEQTEGEDLNMEIGSGPVMHQEIASSESAAEETNTEVDNTPVVAESDTGNISVVSEHLAIQYNAELSKASDDQLDREQKKKTVEEETETHPDPEPVSEKTEYEQKTEDSTEISGNGYVLQLASLKHEEDAAKIIEKLKLRGYNAYSVKVNIPGKGYWHRIRIGGFNSREQAENYKSTIDLSGIGINPKSIFVTEEDK